MDNFNLNAALQALATSPEVDRRAFAYQEALFEDAKKSLIFAFDDHPVTKEIEAGPGSENISGTLEGRGNLFSFIGFPQGSDPTAVIREILDESLVMKNSIKRIANDEIQYSFPISLPTDEIISATPLPFETGNSWVLGIEEGISGFSSFIYKVSKASRSGSGIEVKNGAVFPGYFQPRPYLITMLYQFSEKLAANNFTFE